MYFLSFVCFALLLSGPFCVCNKVHYYYYITAFNITFCCFCTFFFYIINVSDLGQCIVTNISAFNINETVPDLTKVAQQDNKQRRPFKTMHSSTGHK